MRDYKEYTILSAKGEDGSGSAILVDDFSHAVLSVATDGGGTAALTVKFQGSVQADAPTFSNAKSVTNHFDEIEVVDLEDGSHIDGDVGFSVAGADDYRLFELNINALRWLCATVSGYSAGSVTVKVRLFNNF